MSPGRQASTVPPPSSDDLSLTEASERLGVHYMTAYRYVRLGHLDAHKVGGEWRISASELERFTADGARQPVPAAIDFSETRRLLSEALIAGDESRAWDAVQPVLDATDDPTVLHTQLLGPTLREIGEAWASGSLTIAAEHRATAVVRRLIGRSRPWFRGPGRRRGLVVVGAPESDHHSLPTALFADLVRARGSDVIDLGAQTPASTFVDVLHEAAPPMAVCVIVTHSDALEDARQIVRSVNETHPETPVLVGGFAVPDQTGADAIGASHWAPTREEAAELLASLVAAR